MDVLSEVLRVVRLSGAIIFCGEFTQPWAFTSSRPDLLAARLKVPEGSVTPFHVIVDGSCLVTSGKLPPIRIEAGDVIIFPRGDQHVMASDPGIAPVPINDIYSQPSTEQITVLKYGGNGAPARFICGYLHSDQQVGRVLSLLHALPDRPWTVDELAKEAAISRAALAKRFVELVGQSPIQYLAGWRMHLARELLRESPLGIGEIAGRVGYDSEAAFNRAFHRIVGSPPATWRQAKSGSKPANGLSH